MVPVTEAALRAALVDVDYPAMKDGLLEAARRQGASADIEKELRALPPVPYRNLAEVVASVRTDDESAEERATLKAPRRREHAKPGLAEQGKDV